MFGHLMFNVVLALLWCLLAEEFSVGMFIAGFLVSAGVLFVVRRMIGKIVFFRKPIVLAKLVAVFLYELVVANLQVAWLILRPKMRVRPALIRLPVELKTGGAITVLANMISLTPGTISVDVAENKESLVVHCLNVPDVEKAKRAIKERFEKPLRELEK
jgi:multicomponent Na+:H+ antiporter subunit E